MIRNFSINFSCRTSIKPESSIMSSSNIPNELTTLKSAMQKDVEIERVKTLGRKSQWIQVRLKS